MAAAPATQPASPFALRGIKGLWWEGLEKYKLALPWVAEPTEAEREQETASSARAAAA